MIPDIINGSFELCGGILCWKNVLQLYKDKQIHGVDWKVQAFFSFWFFWNLFYYSNLNQWVSFCGGIILGIANITWVIMAVYYIKNKKGVLNEQTD